jgi:RNA polymerase sigma-70 factor, ECF subfamily
MAQRPDQSAPTADDATARPSDDVDRATRTELLMLLDRPRVLAYIERHFPASLRAVLEPEDVLQDTYFEAYRRLESFVGGDDGPGDTSMFRWLVTIARTRIAQIVRTSRAVKRGGRLAQADLGDEVIRMLAELAVHRRTPSRSAVFREFLLLVEDALEQLPEADRLAVTLRYMQDEPPPVIAQRMGRTVEAVHQLCHRAVKKMRALLRSKSRFI